MGLFDKVFCEDLAHMFLPKGNNRIKGILLPPDTLATDACQGLLSCEDGGDGKEEAVEEDLTELEIDPVPEEETLKCTEGENEGQDARRECAGGARGNLGPLYSV